MTARSLVLVALLTVALSSAAKAGLLDSPPPALDGGARGGLGSGGRGKVVYRMGPIYYDPGWVDTMVTCTNVATVPNHVAFEIFDENDQNNGSVARALLHAGDSVTFATSSIDGVSQAVVVPGLLPIDHGKARVTARSAHLSCSALTHFRVNGGTTKDVPLALVKKVATGD